MHVKSREEKNSNDGRLLMFYYTLELVIFKQLFFGYKRFVLERC